MNIYQREVIRHLGRAPESTCSLTLEIAESLYARLAAVAKDRGMSIEQFAVHIISGGE